MRWFIFVVFLSSFLVRAESETNSEDQFQFVTRPDIGAPRWDIKTYDEDKLYTGPEGPYYWFIAPYMNRSQIEYPLWNGPMIYDTSGELIWSGAPDFDYINAFDFRMNEIDGQQTLSFISMKNRGGPGEILDNSYRPSGTVDMLGNYSRINIHELYLIEDGKSALVVTPHNFTERHINVKGYSGMCEIGHQGFKEVDVKTGEVYFEFNTKDHLSPEEHSYITPDAAVWGRLCSQNWDTFHINSVDKFDDGDYLFSARYTNTVYKVSHKDHSIVWRLGGIWSDFVVADEDAEFIHQHHARFQSQNETHTIITLFNNAIAGAHHPDSKSAGLLLALRTDVTPMTSELVTRFEKPPIHNEVEYTKSRGSVFMLPNGNAFIGWVNKCQLSEHTTDGELLMSAVLREPKAATYRAYKLPWVGHPAQPPDVVAAAMYDSVTGVAVSWNGATEVATWNVLRSNSFGNVSTLIASSARQGFETKVNVNGVPKYVIAVALDGDGFELGRSEVVSVDFPPDLQQNSSVADSEQEWISSHSSAWKAPSSPGATTWEKIGWLILGFVCCVVLCCILVWVWLYRGNRRQRISSWRTTRQFPFISVSSSNEDEIGQRRWMLDDEKEENDESDEARGENG